MFDLDRAVSEWRQQMAAGGVKAADVLDELESHLRDNVDTQVQSGLSVQQAFETALQRMGEATLLRDEFQKADKARRKRLQARMLFCLAIVFGCVTVSAVVGYLVIFPLALRASGQYASWLGIQAPHASFDFVWRFARGMGLALAMPVSLLCLASMGALTYRKLTSLRRYMIVANFILAAVLTTPEVMNQIVVFVPLQLLCEASIWMVRLMERRELKHA